MSVVPLVSVVMPVYNCAKFIEEAIDSILYQTFSDFELIIIDDASTDGTTEILKKYTDTRIKLIIKDKNQGVSAATNEGFRLAKGKYIARMDGDDVSIKERFEKQLEVLENNDRIIVCGSLVQYTGGSNSIIPHKEYHNEIVSELLISCSICMGAAMFRREELANYFYDETKNSGEDYDFWTKVAWLGEMYNIQEVLLLYRVHPNQASIIHKPKQILDDVQIKLNLFKKINYDTQKYTDTLIAKILLLISAISINELELFLKWIDELYKSNLKSKVYPPKELNLVLKRIKRTLLFSLFFKKTEIGIDKRWRIKALLKLPFDDFYFVSKLKFRELVKVWLK